MDIDELREIDDIEKAEDMWATAEDDQEIEDDEN